MKHNVIYIIRDSRSLIQGYVDSFEEAISICQKKNDEYCAKKWSYQPIYHVPKSLK